MTQNELLNLDLDAMNKLSRSDLAKAVTTLGRNVNSRLNRFKRSGIESPATSYIERSGGKISARGKALNELRSEFVRAKGFLQSQTGSIAGAVKVQNKVISQLKNMGINISREQYNVFWKTYEKLKELKSSISDRAYKYAVLDEIEEKIKDTGKSPDEIAISMSKELESIYENLKNKEKFDGVSGFFDDGENL